jgi:hypothetical protein
MNNFCLELVSSHHGALVDHYLVSTMAAQVPMVAAGRRKIKYAKKPCNAGISCLFLSVNSSKFTFT